MNLKVNFSGRAHHYTQEEIDVVVKAMSDAEPLTQGKYIKEFESRFGEYIGAEHCFAVCNATAALEMAAQLCQFKTGDEVIIPSHTFTSSAYPFLKKGAKIVWADIDPHSRVVTAQAIERKLTPSTKAIVVVHLYGYAADMPEIMKVADKHNLIVVEDTAQSLGSEIAGKQTGTFGDFGVFSFHSHKNITTLGEGGMLVVRDKTMAKIVPMLRHNGHCGFPFDRDDYWIPAMGNVDFPNTDGATLLWPNNYCLGEIESALGAKLLERIDRINEEKRTRALSIIDMLSDFPELEFHRVDSRRHNYHLLVARVADGKRDEFIRRMYHNKGIKCVVQYYPLNRYPLYQKAGFGTADCPEADTFFDNMVSFPFHHWLTDEEIQYIVQSAIEILTDIRHSS